MKHRHKLQQQRRSTTTKSRRAEDHETLDEQPNTGKAKKPGGSIHAAKAKHHLGKRGRTGQHLRRYDDGGVASGPTGSTRNPNDPGGEIAAANRGRKSVGEWIRDEIFTGGRPAYARGGRQRPKKFDDGGSIADASPIAAPNLAFGSGPPAPPRTADDGSAISAAPPRANDPSFANRLSAAQKNAQLKQRVKQLEGKGR